jgi:hypothetical protein
LARARKLGFVWAHAPINEPNFRPRKAPLPAKAEMPFEPLNIPLVDLEKHHCREVVSPDGAIAAFCGHDKKPGSSYCPFHSARNEYLAPAKSAGTYFRPPGRAA